MHCTYIRGIDMDWGNIFNALLQGILQGLTEFLPVSSSGHLSLFQHFTGQSGEGALFFTVMLHMGTLLALFIAYHKLIAELIMELFRMIGAIFTGKFSFKQAGERRRMVIMLIISLVPLIAFYFVKDFFATLSEDNDIIVEGVCFLFTGCLLFLADRCVKGKKTALSMKPGEALSIGLMQCAAAGLPGVSRSGSTISTGLLNGLSREYAVQFSFIMGIPAMLAANVVELSAAIKSEEKIDMIPLAVGIVAAVIVGLVAIRLIQWLVKTDRFRIFAYYTLTLGVIVLIIGMIELFIGRSMFEVFGGTLG